MSELISWIGSICSIVGAIIALRQAGIAKNSAGIAQSIKIQLSSHRVTSELSELQVLLNAAQNSFNKYGAASPAQLKGIDHNSDAQVVLSFINKLKSLRDYFSDHSDNVADDIYEEINSLLADFRSTTAAKNISGNGSKILTAITGFSPHLQRELTAQKEHTV